MTGDLLVFLRARLDEDEQLARAATAGPWSTMGQAVLDPTPPSDRLGIGMAVGHAAATADYNETAAHIARHDPARVLAEVEAKRRVLSRHGAAPLPPDYPNPGMPSYCAAHAYREGGATVYPVQLADCPDLRDLASVYASHPDYRAEWRP